MKDSLDEKFFHQSKRLKWLKPLIREMHICIDAYGAGFEWDDLSYFYNERASVSVLAGAAWRLNWVALEEFRDRKSSSGSGHANAKKQGWGRADLYVGEPETFKNPHEMYFEAKKIFPTPGVKKETLGKALDSAWNEAKRLKGRSAQSGLLFVAPRIPQGEDVLEGCGKIIDNLKALEPELLMWHFPEMARLHPSSKRPRHFESMNGKRYVYPGLITAIKVARAPHE